MRKYFGLMILAVVAVILAVLYFILIRETDPNKTGKFFSISSSDSITEVKITNKFDTFLFVKEEDVWKLKEPGNYNVNQLKLQLLESALLDMQINRVLDQELPDYGLQEPGIVVEFSTKKNIHKTLFIGNFTPSKSQVYIKDADSGEVFVSDIGTTVQFDGSLAAYRGKEVFSVNKDQVNEITYLKSGVKTLTVTYLGPQNWQITYPITAPARYLELSELMVSMRKWTAAGYPDTTSGDYAKYGLDNPANSLILTDASGKSQTIEFGNTTGGLIYTRTGSKEDILQLFSVDVDFSLFTVEKLLFVLPLQTKIDNVAEITIESSVKSSTFKLDHSKSPIEVTLSGVQIPYEDFISLFVNYVGLSADGYDDTTKPGQNSFTLSTTFLDGSKESINLLVRTSDSYFIESVENKEFYIDKEQVDEMINSWASILAKTH